MIEVLSLLRSGWAWRVGGSRATQRACPLPRLGKVSGAALPQPLSDRQNSHNPR